MHKSNQATHLSIWLTLSLVWVSCGNLHANPNLFVEIGRVETPPVIDGRLDDWAQVQWIPFAPGAPHMSSGESNQLRDDGLTESTGTAGTDADVSGSFALQWDEERIYLAAQVTDNVHDVIGGTAEQWYLKDSVSLFLDIPLDGDGVFFYTGDHAFSFVADPTHPEYSKWWRRGSAKGPQEVPAPPKTRMAVQITEDGYDLEAIIPMGVLTQLTPDWHPPFEGRTVGFMLLVADPDGGNDPFGGQLIYGGDGDNDAFWASLRLRQSKRVVPPYVDPTLSKRIDNISRNIRKNTFAQMVFSVVPLSFAILHLFLFLFYPRLKANFYYSVFLAFLAVLLFRAFSGSSGPINILLLVLLFPSVLRFFYSLFYAKLPKQFWVLSFLEVGLGISFEFVSNTNILVLFYGTLYFWTASCLSIIVEGVRVLLLAIFRKKEGAWVVGLGGMFLCAVGARTLLAEIGIHVGGSSQYDEYWWPIAPLGFIFSMSIYLARQFGQTSNNLEAQLVQVKELSAQALEQERRIRDEEIQRQLLEGELNTAHDMQMSLMPTESPQIKGFDIIGRCIPADHVGGDFFQYFPISGSRLAISLADVTGHAMEAAIPVVMFSGILDTQVETGNTLEDLFTKLNRSLCRNLAGRRTYVCFTMGELDTATRIFRLSNGGCPYPYHYKAITGEITELQVNAYPLGVHIETIYPVIETQLEPGDRIVFCSDGIIEAENSERELFGFERTAETIRRGCSQDLSAPQILDYLINEVKTFTGSNPQGDDQTIVVLQVES